MIQVKHLTKKFGDFFALNDVSFEIMPGETFALLGPNGSGKSTMLKCLLGLSVPNSGQVSIKGLDLWKHAREARSLMSFLPQRVGFDDNLTAREVMRFYCDLRKTSPHRVDELLGGSRFDFNGFSDKPVREFSGGMLQRLGLAVACLPDAPILVLDEPTVGLDPEGAIRFREFLASLKGEGKTIVFSSHVLTDVEQLADRVAILVGGRLVSLESIEAMREGLMCGCRMRVALFESDERYIVAARRAGASGVTLQGDSLLISSRPADRLAILHAIEAAGGRVARFATQEQSLEDIYLGYINGESADSHKE